MTARATCRHMTGDHITEMNYWLCSVCWSKLDRRPVKYGPVSRPLRGADGKMLAGGTRQEITWQAEQHVAPGGLRLADFLRTMTRRFMFRSRDLSLEDAYQIAIDTLAILNDPYGDPAYDWTHDGAREMADAEMDYWDQDGDGGNA